MTTMITEVYDAFRSVGVPEDKARAAAEALSLYDGRFARIERRLAVLSWQINATSALVAMIGAPSIWLLLRIAAKVVAL